MRVRFVGLEPKIKPVDPENGWNEFSVHPGSTVADVLNRFGLNGSLTDIEEIVVDKDELQILLKSLGG